MDARCKLIQQSLTWCEAQQKILETYTPGTTTDSGRKKLHAGLREILRTGAAELNAEFAALMTNADIADRAKDNPYAASYRTYMDKNPIIQKKVVLMDELITTLRQHIGDYRKGSSKTFGEYRSSSYSSKGSSKLDQPLALLSANLAELEAIADQLNNYLPKAYQRQPAPTAEIKTPAVILIQKLAGHFGMDAKDISYDEKNVKFEFRNVSQKFKDFYTTDKADTYQFTGRADGTYEVSKAGAEGLIKSVTPNPSSFMSATAPTSSAAAFSAAAGSAEAAAADAKHKSKPKG